MLFDFRDVKSIFIFFFPPQKQQSGRDSVDSVRDTLCSLGEFCSIDNINGSKSASAHSVSCR